MYFFNSLRFTYETAAILTSNQVLRHQFRGRDVPEPVDCELLRVHGRVVYDIGRVRCERHRGLVHFARLEPSMRLYT